MELIRKSYYLEMELFICVISITAGLLAWEALIAHLPKRRKEGRKGEGKEKKNPIYNCLKKNEPECVPEIPSS